LLKQQYENLSIGLPYISIKYGKPNNKANGTGNSQFSHINFKAKNPLMDSSIVNGNYNIALLNIKNNAEALKEIPRGLRTIFKELKDETGENFVHKAYSKLRKYMKLDGIAPDEIGRLGPDEVTHSGAKVNIEGGYNPRNNSISYTDGFFNRLEKHEQLNFLAHELKHAEQASKIIRSGLISQYAGTWAKFQVSGVLQNPLNVPVQMALKKARENGKLSEFVKGAMFACKDETLKDMTKGHANTLKLPQYSPKSIGYKEGTNYFESYKTYSNNIYDSEYKNNPIEIEAYAFGNQIEKHFQIYSQINKF